MVSRNNKLILSLTGIDFLQAQLIDLAGNLQRRKMFPCSHAFIQELGNENNRTSFSYPLFYLDNATALPDDDWASASRAPVVRLDWLVAAENCSQAKRNPSLYACQDNKSVCVDRADNFRLSRGHLCSCVQGYQGNPYLPGGCKR